MPSTRPILLLLVALCLAGCASNGPTSTYEELGQAANTRGFGRQYPQDPNENDFVFGVGDEVVVSVTETPEFAEAPPVVIRQDGKITLPLVNEIEAAGLTTDQLRKKIATLLSLYVIEPKVTVSPGRIVSKNYFVVAQDRQSGSYKLVKVPYEGDTLLLDVFAEMGSPSSLLDDDTHVKVIRGDPRNPAIYTVNVREIMLEGRTGGNIRILPDDIIYVPPTFLGRLNRFVAGVSYPFQSLFLITRSVVEVDYSVRILTGSDDDFGRGRVFF